MIASNQTAKLANRELELRIERLLAQQSYPSLRKLRVTVHPDHVLLSGCVATFHEKQIASCCAQQEAGPLEVVNKIDVPSHLPR